jgi:hypothetical protein
MGTDPVGVDMSFAQPVGLPIVSSSCLDDLCVCVGSCSEGGIRASFWGGGGGGGGGFANIVVPLVGGPLSMEVASDA